MRVEGELKAGSTYYPSDEVTYPDTLVLRLPGLEFVENMTPPTGGVAYSGQRLLAQQIHVRDLDEQINNVTINPIVVKNIGTATSTDVVKVEIWRQNTLTATEIKLGETTDLSGFRTGGARIELTHDNVLIDTASGVEAYLNVYLTMAEPEVMVAARTIQLETRVLHTENLQSFDKMASSNQWTLETNHRPVVDFTFAVATGTASVQAKADFTYEQTIQFTGTATDADSDAIASWAWTFGDGSTASVQNPTHRYPNGGTFTVTLTVTDARGVTGSKSKTTHRAGAAQRGADGDVHLDAASAGSDPGGDVHLDGDGSGSADGNGVHLRLGLRRHRHEHGGEPAARVRHQADVHGQAHRHGRAERIGDGRAHDLRRQHGPHVDGAHRDPDRAEHR